MKSESSPDTAFEHLKKKVLQLQAYYKPFHDSLMDFGRELCHSNIFCTSEFQL